MSVRSPIKWFGGKSWLVPKLLELMPPHHTYVEGFAGGMWFLLNKPKVDAEIANDINKLLVNFWMVLRDHADLLAKECEMLPDSEELYKKFKDYSIFDFKEPGLGELEWDSWEKYFGQKWLVKLAAAFIYLNTHSYSGMFTGFHGLNYSTPTQNQGAFLSKVELLRSNLWERLKLVTFTCKSIHELLEDILAKGDRDDTFIYLDPPYFQGGDLYQTIPGGKAWDMTDFIRLRNVLHKFKHAKVLISIDNGEFFLTDGWNMFEVDKTIKIRAEAEIGRECLVLNYKPPSNVVTSTFDPLQF